MKTVILNGQLGKLFGKRHKFDVKTAAEAVRALVANFPDFERHMMQTEGVGYRVKLHKEPLQELEQLHHPVGNTITITPVVSGAGRGGLGQILLGAVIIGAAFATGGAFLVGAVGPTGIGTTFLGSIAVGIGTSLMLGGVASMLAPKPKTMEPGNRPENKPSYAFNGPVNTTAQGNPVPIGYGRMIVGGAVISAGLSTEEIPV